MNEECTLISEEFKLYSLKLSKSLHFMCLDFGFSELAGTIYHRFRGALPHIQLDIQMKVHFLNWCT